MAKNQNFRALLMTRYKLCLFVIASNGGGDGGDIGVSVHTVVVFVYVCVCVCVMHMDTLR